MINVYVLVDTVVWVKRPFTTVQAAMVAWRLLRADDHVAFVVIERVGP
jgi:hypothetical protein